MQLSSRSQVGPGGERDEKPSKIGAFIKKIIFGISTIGKSMNNAGVVDAKKAYDLATEYKESQIPIALNQILDKIQEEAKKGRMSISLFPSIAAYSFDEHLPVHIKIFNDKIKPKLVELGFKVEYGQVANQQYTGNNHEYVIIFWDQNNNTKTE